MTKKRLYEKVKTLKLVSLLLFAVLLLFNTREIGLATQKGLRLCFSVIIPSLFPFFILSRMLTPLLCGISTENKGLFTRFFHISPAGKSALLLGFISGFPIGAKTVASLYRSGDVTREEAFRLLCFCNNTGPAFVIGTVGTLFHSLPFGIFLYLLQIFIASMTGIVLGIGKKENSQKKPSFTQKKKPVSQDFPEIVVDSGASVLKVCAFVVAFQILIDIASSIIKNLFELCTAIMR